MCSGTRQATKILSFRSSESRSHLLASGLLQLSVEQTLARTRVLDEAAARCDRGGFYANATYIFTNRLLKGDCCDYLI